MIWQSLVCSGSIATNENVYEPVKIKRIKRRNDEKSTKKENKRL